jgi:hypothetical protein
MPCGECDPATIAFVYSKKLELNIIFLTWYSSFLRNILVGYARCLDHGRPMDLQRLIDWNIGLRNAHGSGLRIVVLCAQTVVSYHGRLGLTTMHWHPSCPYPQALEVCLQSQSIVLPDHSF